MQIVHSGLKYKIEFSIFNALNAEDLALSYVYSYKYINTSFLHAELLHFTEKQTLFQPKRSVKSAWIPSVERSGGAAREIPHK